MLNYTYDDMDQCPYHRKYRHH